MTDDASAAAFSVLYGIFKETGALEKRMEEKEKQMKKKQSAVPAFGIIMFSQFCRSVPCLSFPAFKSSIGFEKQR